MINRRLVSLLLVLVTLVSLLPLSAVPARAATNVNLTVWLDSYSMDWVQSRVADFNSQSTKWNISVALGALSPADSGTIVAADPQSAADVYIYASDQLGNLVQAGALAPISGSALTQVKNDNAQTLINSVTHTDGKIYGIPYTSNTWFMYYDKSVFSESDVKSLETMLQKGTVAFPLTNGWYLSAFYLANGCTMFGENGNDPLAGIDFYNPEGIEVTKYLVDLVAHTNFVLDDADSALYQLSSGEVNAVFSGTWISSSVQAELGDNYAAAQLPTVTIGGKQRQLKALAGCKAYGVNPHSANIEAAMEFAAFLGNRDSQIDRYELFLDVPACPDLESSLADDPAALAQINTIANTSAVQPVLPEMYHYWDPALGLGTDIALGNVTKSNAETYTKGYVLPMNNGLLITGQPADQAASNGEQVSVTVTAEGTSLRYAWYFKNAGATTFSKSSVTKATYSTVMSDSVDGRQIYCIVTDSYGTQRRSKVATLDMTATELKITRQPSSVTVAEGETAKVTVGAVGDGLSYRWYYKNPGASAYTYTSSFKGNSYYVTMNEARNGRWVLCRVYDKYGNVVQTNTVKLSMKNTVKIVQQPVSVTVAEGEMATVTVKATGDGLTYRWYYKNPGETKYTYTSTYTGNTYKVPMNEARNGRWVLCRVYDKYGNVVQTNTVVLRMS